MDELRKRKDAVERSVSVIRQNFRNEVEALKRKGTIPQASSEQLIASCVMGRLNANAYPNRPIVSFMLQYFKRPWIVKPMVDALLKCRSVVPTEPNTCTQVVVNVDNPAEAKEWADLSYSTDGFVVPVFSANVHEIRAYNRLAHLARGKYLVIMQDDQLPPEDCSWLKQAVTTFEDWPLIGAIGFNGGRLNMFGGNHDNHAWFKDKTTGIAMEFVQNIDFAPMALRATAFKHVGGLDETMSEPGECGIWSDWEFSTRLWMAGWQVAYRYLQGRRGDEGHASGTHKPEAGVRCWGRQQNIGSGVFNRRWRPHGVQLTDQLAKHIRALNFALLEFTGDMSPGKCPFSKDVGGCENIEAAVAEIKLQSPGW